jgi:hypothetical protein
VNLPGADTDLSLDEYARVVCGVCDIPVYGSLVQSLHVLFTLYNEFKSNAHFMNLNGSSSGTGIGNGVGSAGGMRFMGAGEPAGGAGAYHSLGLDDSEDGKHV